MKICTKAIALLAVGFLVLAGCTQQAGQKQTLGTLLGAGAGAAIGSQIGSGRGQLAAVAVGTLLGAAVGSEMGARLDEQDRRLAAAAERQAHAAPIGETIEWENPETGHHGTVTPIREGRQQATGHYCREYQTEIIVGGKVESGYGTACRQPDGSWEIVG